MLLFFFYFFIFLQSMLDPNLGQITFRKTAIVNMLNIDIYSIMKHVASLRARAVCCVRRCGKD